MTKKSILNPFLIDNKGDAPFFARGLGEEGLRNHQIKDPKNKSEAEKHLAAHSVDIILTHLGSGCQK